MTCIKRLTRMISLLMFIGVAAVMLSACGSSAAEDGAAPAPSPELSVITEVDLSALLSQGKPVILNFGDGGQGSAGTLDALGQINRDYGESILIYTVDLVQNPQAREGFPIQVIPSQFFYTAEGQPINLPLGIGVVISTFLSVDTEETVFTIHEGAISAEDLIKVLDYMDITTAK